MAGLPPTPPSRPHPLTTLVGADGPGLGQIKVGVAPDAVPREEGVRQESSLAVKRRAVAVETLGEGQHDVGVLVHLVSYVAVRNLPEGYRDDAFPDLEGFADGLIRGPLADLRGVVLYAGGQLEENETSPDDLVYPFSTTLTYLKVTSDLSHFRPWTAYLFRLRLVFSSGPNLSGTPHRGLRIALTTTQGQPQRRKDPKDGSKRPSVDRDSLYRLRVDGAGDRQAVEPLHGLDRRLHRFWRADGLSSDIAWGQVAKLLEPALREEKNRRA